ncbi:hypothetical protein CCACVL1_01940 [Corchorus capsularis]|uniref:AT hook, DNA-binding motif-containing protein n=1 Tax=Corchorus capsularis TaxID=210143 RepID=A0A1R3KE82_COCAP|nr:hypothetical protein CCACVL1_01940 [Corchorus capsularis]
MMNQDNKPENSPDASADIPVKRKRGRPRKHPKYLLNRRENAETLNRAENTDLPPVFEGANGNQPRQADRNYDANDAMVGQSVYGVIEAAFDAGYLLTVRVGNSDTTLRGVVFRPGHYVPVSADNDVAPNVQLVRRNEIPFPRGMNEQHVNSHRNGTAHPFNQPANQVPRPRASNLGGSKSKHVHSVATQSVSPLTSRGHLVPVVLQPANLPNGGMVANQPSLVTAQSASRGKQMSEAAHTLNSGTPNNQMPTVGDQIFPTQTQSSNQIMPKGIQSETVSHNQPPANVFQETDIKSMAVPGMRFEKLLTEVMKRVPSQPMDAQGGNMPVEDSGHSLEDDQPLSIEPLQAVQPAQSSPVLKPMENFRAGKMTELLQAVQEKTRENTASRTEEPAAGPGHNKLGGIEMHDSNKH